MSFVTKPSKIFTPKVFHALKVIFLKVYIMLGDACLNKVDVMNMETAI